MLHDLPFFLLALLLLNHPVSEARPNPSSRWSAVLDYSKRWFSRSYVEVDKRFSQFEVNNDGSTFLWLLQDDYSGDTFFDGFGFFDGDDPTNGLVDYVNSSYAFERGLAYVGDNNEVIMKGDNTTWLAEGVYRESVRISSYAQYNTGLFILDLNHAPWGCGVWPAFWTLGSGPWPQVCVDIKKIDIIEGVHDNSHNQIAWHTGDGCYLNPNASFTGNVVTSNGENNTNCDGTVNSNSGCGIIEWSRASYGPYFDQQGGGVFAMKWDENGIAVYSFYRVAIPKDIEDGSPTPSTWGVPDAYLDPEFCDPIQYFVNHSVIFDITFCGDWAGNSYATTTCPGTCPERLMDPANFVNASWSINSLKVYRKQTLNTSVDGSVALYHTTSLGVAVISFLIISLATLVTL